MAEKVYRRGTEGGRGIIELAGGALEVDSFTAPGVRYKVHADSGYCSCPAFTHRGLCRKHVALAESIQKARSLRSGSQIAEENVIELCGRIFAPITSRDNYMDSYNLFLETVAYRYSTEAMVRKSLRRHGRVLAMHESRRAA